MTENLYVHFPFCRQKCSYCALYSRCGDSAADREAYVQRLVSSLEALDPAGEARFLTIYFGGGSPALCDLRPILKALETRRASSLEFTVELHPKDITPELLETLKSGGVTRISMGVQSLDNDTLEAMGRGYTIEEARRAFDAIRERFDNAGIDLILGYPRDPCCGWELLREWGLTHCSVYSLQNERGLEDVPDDDWTLDRIRSCASVLSEIGLARYEISNYARPGFECRHNLAVWRGEDYLGLGEGAHGRVGLTRTVGRRMGVTTSVVTPAEDMKERTLFRLRTRDGLDATRFPEWAPILAKYVQEGLLTQSDSVYRLTDRGTEVCDTILTDLV